MINHELGLVFIHIPKCAGSSFEAAFGHFKSFYGNGAQDHRTIRMLQQPWLCISAFKTKSNIIELGRRFAWNYYHPASNPLNKTVLTRDQFQRYTKVSMIRNPWSRVVSWYHNVIESDYHISRLKIRPDISFKEFLFKFGGYGPLRSQMDWLVNFSGDVEFGYLVRFENVKDLVSDLSKSLGVHDVKLPHLIKSMPVDYRKMYDSESFDYVEKVYACEIKRFKFAFDDERRVQSW
jgi:hypothetical protein